MYLERNLNNRPGALRYGNSYIQIRTGETYYPPIPTMQDVKNILYLIYSEQEPIIQALTALALFAKSHFFDDGNKRTAQMMANHILAYNNSGCMFCVPFGRNGDFKQILGQFYIDKYTLNDTIELLKQFIF